MTKHNVALKGFAFKDNRYSVLAVLAVLAVWKTAFDVIFFQNPFKLDSWISIESKKTSVCLGIIKKSWQIDENEKASQAFFMLSGSDYDSFFKIDNFFENRDCPMTSTSI